MTTQTGTGGPASVSSLAERIAAAEKNLRIAIEQREVKDQQEREGQARENARRLPRALGVPEAPVLYVTHGRDSCEAHLTIDGYEFAVSNGGYVCLLRACRDCGAAGTKTPVDLHYWVDNGADYQVGSNLLALGSVLGGLAPQCELCYAATRRERITGAAPVLTPEERLVEALRVWVREVIAEARP